MRNQTRPASPQSLAAPAGPVPPRVTAHSECRCPRSSHCCSSGDARGGWVGPQFASPQAPNRNSRARGQRELPGTGL